MEAVFGDVNERNVFDLMCFTFLTQPGFNAEGFQGSGNILICTRGVVNNYLHLLYDPSEPKPYLCDLEFPQSMFYLRVLDKCFSCDFVT